MSSKKKIGLFLLLVMTSLIPYSVNAKTIKDFENEVNNFTKSLEEKEAKIAKNDQEVAEIKKNIASYEKQISDLETSMKSLEEEIDKGNKMVIGSRFVTDKRPNSFRMLGNTLISFAIKLTTGKTINDPTSGMRMFSKDLIQVFARNINYGPEPDTVSYLLRNGVPISEVQVRMEERQAGESYLTFSRSIKYMIHMFVSILFIQNFRERGK